MNRVQKSFIREILKVTENPVVISFAGGLPNPKSFPVEDILKASEKVLIENERLILFQKLLPLYLDPCYL